MIVTVAGGQNHPPQLRFTRLPSGFPLSFLIPVFLGEDFHAPERTEKATQREGEGGNLHGWEWIYHGGIGGDSQGAAALRLRARDFFGF